MFLDRGIEPLCYRRLTGAELGLLDGLQLDPEQVDRFLGPIRDIVSAVRQGRAHSLVGIEAPGALVGFFVVHPEPRDNACWWLGWLALDQRQQGRGYGCIAMLAVMERLRQIPNCRRVRLLVAPDNLRARALYDRFGFRTIGRSDKTGELVLEAALPTPAEVDGLRTFLLLAVAARARRVFRHRRLRLTSGPHPAWVIGVERGPPARLCRAGHTGERCYTPRNCRERTHAGRATRARSAAFRAA